MSGNKGHSRTRRRGDPHAVQVAVQDAAARQYGPDKRKSWNVREIKNVRALTERQADAVHAFLNGNHVAMLGSAGTGKTYLATYLAFNEVLRESAVSKVIFVRSTVQTRQQGFLPGTIEEKYAPFEEVYRGILQNLFNRAATYDDMKEAGLIEFHSTSFLRGTTWDNAIVIIDEAQNLTFHELNSVVTRLGKGSRLMVVGDTLQCDFEAGGELSGLGEFCAIALLLRQIVRIDFRLEDIVRSPFVRDWLVAVAKHREGAPPPHGKPRLHAVGSGA